MALNHIDIQGRLTADPEMRYTQNNTPVVSFTLACDNDFVNKETGKRDAVFVRCTGWRSTAEFVSKYFSKGSPAIVSGKLSQNKWTDSNGNNRNDIEIIIDNIYFAGGKKETAPINPEFNDAPVDFSEVQADDGDLPF